MSSSAVASYHIGHAAPAGFECGDQAATASLVLRFCGEDAGVDEEPVDLNEPGEWMLLEHRVPGSARARSSSAVRWGSSDRSKRKLIERPERLGEDVPLGTIRPGVVSLHSHADPETFLAVSGELEGLVHSAEGLRWVRIGAGDVFHVPGEAKHAFRNQSREPAVMIVVSTAKIGRFFREIGTPGGPGSTTAWPPSGEAIQHFLETAERYGYGNATPVENAEVGLPLRPVG